MVKKPYLKIYKIRDFDETNPYTSGIITPKMNELIKSRIPKKLILEDKATVTISGQIPLSLNSKNINKFKKSIREGINHPKDLEFKEKTKERELELDIVFFLARDYKNRDVDNLIKPFIDALKRYLFDDDSQIKKITAEKYQVTDTEEGVDNRFYEQIYCCIVIID